MGERYRLKDKVIIVTGASSGIGAEAARAFAEEGAKVVLCARRDDKLAANTEEIVAKGGEACWIHCDTTQLEDLDALVDFTLEKYGRIDVLLHNAGTGHFFDIHKMDLEKDYYWMVDLFMRSSWYLSSKILPHMIEQGSGDIIFTLSTAAVNGVARGSVYSGTKAAVRNLSKAIAQGYGKYNIRCNTIMPGLITTELSDPGGVMEQKQVPFIPMGRPGNTREVANCLVFMASDECRFMTGVDITIDGGNDVGIMYPGPSPEI